MPDFGKIDLTLYQTYFTVKVDKYGNACPQFNLERIVSHLKEFDWDIKSNRYYVKYQYFSFDKLNSEIRFPRHFLSVLQNEATSRGIEIVYTQGKLVTPRHIVIPRNPTWKDRNEQQTQCIDFLVNNPEPMCGLAIQPGKGKTYCGITAAIKKEQPILIIVDGLTSQWLESLYSQTLLTPDQIWLLQGHDSIAKIFQLDKDKKPYVFVASLDTIFRYAVGVGAMYQNIPTYAEFLEYFGIGIILMDECHLNFNSLMAIALRSNVQHNWYLSATPRKSTKQADRIYKLVFPEEMFFGKQFYHKYIKIISNKYAIPVNNIRKIRTPKGYSHLKYEQYLMANPMYLSKFLNDVILPFVQNEYYVVKKPGQKLLVLVSLIKMADKVKDFLQKQYPDLKVVTLLGRDPDTNKDNCDIIVSNHASAGTGTDISHLLTAADTCSFRGACTLTEQAPGRLREIPGSVVRYGTFYNQFIPDQVRHYQERAEVYRNIAGEFVER